VLPLGFKMVRVSATLTSLRPKFVFINTLTQEGRNQFFEHVSDSKTLFIVPTDAHYYKNHRMLKQFKIITLVPTCFSSRRNHHQGAVLCLTKTNFFFLLVVIDAVNVMAAYQPVLQHRKKHTL
jgi:hypothetical protein